MKRITRTGIEVDVVYHRHQVKLHPREVRDAKRQMRRRERHQAKQNLRRYED